VQIQALPSAIGRLMELALFDASDNKLTTVPRYARNPIIFWEMQRFADVPGTNFWTCRY